MKGNSSIKGKGNNWPHHLFVYDIDPYSKFCKDHQLMLQHMGSPNHTCFPHLVNLGPGLFHINMVFRHRLWESHYPCEVFWKLGLRAIQRLSSGHVWEVGCWSTRVSLVLHALDNDCLWLTCRGLMVVGDSAQECKVPTHVKGCGPTSPTS